MSAIATAKARFCPPLYSRAGRAATELARPTAAKTRSAARALSSFERPRSAP